MAEEILLNKKLPTIVEGKKYHAMSEGLIFFLQPSAKYPGYWWVCKIEQGVWEGFELPIAPLLLNYWATSLPENLEWQAQDWDGDEMSILQDHLTPKPAHDVIYFVEAVGLDRVKIGLTSGSPESRISSLQLLSPVELRVIGQMAGSLKLEQSLHKRFSHLHVRGEWFQLTSEIQSYIKENAQ